MYRRCGKRLFDVVASLALLLVIAPALVVLMLAIFIDDGRPFFFRQWRVGRHADPFEILKFRSMRHVETREDGFDAGNATRVTRVGRWLRTSKLDELPQLVNVLRGDMSLVGPRPEVRAWVDARSRQWEKVLGVRPGITDNASIIYRHEERELALQADPEAHYRDVVLPRKLDLYEAYVDHVSARTDLAILGRTVIGLFKTT